MNDANCLNCLALQAEVARLQSENGELLERLGLMKVRHNSRAEAAEAEVARLTQEQETLKSWQPMETAPKDGTNVLVCWHDGATASMFAVGHNLGDGRRWQNTHDWLHNERSWPTHWMPVPDPPAALASLPQEGTK
jgi:hypothetical protein